MGSLSFLDYLVVELLPYMNEDQSTLKKTSKIALAAMGVLFIVAIVFYKERLFFCDAAFCMYNIINLKTFYIQNSRYGAFITQVLPLLEQKLHLSLKTIMVSYAVSFNLFFLTSTVIVAYGYKQYRLAILMALYYFLFVSESYIWIGETFQGIAWMGLFFTATQQLKNKTRGMFLLSLIPFSLLAFITVFSHFVVLIPLIFLWVYLIIEKDNWPFPRNVSILLTCILIMVIALKFTGTHSAYDNENLYNVTHFSLKDIIDTFQTPVLQMFFYRCVVNYWLGVLIFIVSIVVLIKKKKTALAIWTFVSVLGYVIIMGLTYANNNTPLFHIESEWSCIGILIATPFAFTLLSDIKPMVGIWLLSGIFIIRLVYILSSITSFTARIDMEKEILVNMKKKGITKLILLGDEKVEPLTKLYWWGIPYESIFLSASENDKPQRTFFITSKDDKRPELEKLKDPTQFYDVWYVIPIKNLNQEYFNIDTTKSYQAMTYEDLLK